MACGQGNAPDARCQAGHERHPATSGTRSRNTKSRRYNSPVPKRSPYDVLGVEVDASGPTIKAAWRRLARQHHPDTTGGDAQAARAATRRMAEINAAYEELRDPVKRRAAADRARAEAARAGRPFGGRPSAGDGADGATSASGAEGGGGAPRRGGPPRPRPARPVTARVDMSDLYQPRNQTRTNGHRPYA